jgi:YARHG domain
VAADSLTRKLSWEELRRIDCTTLWVARNKMYARSNACLSTPIGYWYFGKDATCDPTIESPNTPIDEENARAIGRMLARNRCVTPLDSCKKLGRVASSKLDLDRRTVKEVQ